MLLALFYSELVCVCAVPSTQSMSAARPLPGAAAATVAATRTQLQAYVDEHPQCTDLALPLWVAYVTSSSSSGSRSSSSSSSGNGSGGGVTQFPPSAPQPPVFIDVPGIALRSGVELSAHPHKAGRADGATDTMKGKEGGRAAVKARLSDAQIRACLSDMISLLALTAENFPEASYKSTMASTHWVW